ncbi:MAG: chromate efflux transporter [Hyphomicrobiales bacterium]|nr:chromate efflux transporter [Hyphomicrobiales bacterium]MDE2016791.1 chromate efflux transporter [Hyphomicrobiales bacterium]
MTDAPSAPSLREALPVWTKIGLLSFGGPAGQIALMHAELVEKRRWIGERRFLHALGYCMLLPGPEALQLAIYVGWLLNRTAGGIVAGALFVLPGAFVMLALSALYATYRSVPLVEAAFFGIKAAVLALVVEALLRIGRRALRGRAAVGLAVAAFLALFAFGLPYPAVVAAAALIGWLGDRAFPGAFAPAAAKDAGDDGDAVVDAMFARGELDHAAPSGRRFVRAAAIWGAVWLAPPAAVAALTGVDGVYSRIGAFFTLTSVVTFGGAYAALSYVAQAAVGALHWLTPSQMLDGLGLAETTPGPLILVLQFVGFFAAYGSSGSLPPLLAGVLGAALASWATFVPCWLWIFAGGPYIESLRGNRALGAALAGITAAVVGVVLDLSTWFSLHVLFRDLRPVHFAGLSFDAPAPTSFDARAALLAAAAMVATLRLRLGMGWTLAAAAAGGLALKLLA